MLAAVRAVGSFLAAHGEPGFGGDLAVGHDVAGFELIEDHDEGGLERGGRRPVHRVGHGGGAVVEVVLVVVDDVVVEDVVVVLPTWGSVVTGGEAAGGSD